MNNILVVGSINMDMVINTQRVPVLGETLLGSGFMTVAGGKGQNQAIAAARLGCNVKMIGAVGDDIYGQALIQNLSSNQVDTTGIQTKNTNSGVAVITVCNGDNHIILDGGANIKVDKNTIDANADLFGWADIVVFQFELPIDTVDYAVRTAKRYNKLTILNPAPMIDFDVELLRYVDIFIPNQHEASALLNCSINTAEQGTNAIPKLLQLGAKQAIITMGEHGCVYNNGNKVKHQKAYSNITVVDTTAAGDSFVGGICKGICSGLEITQSIEYATAVSALTISKKGATPSLPFERDVKNFENSKNCI